MSRNQRPLIFAALAVLSLGTVCVCLLMLAGLIYPRLAVISTSSPTSTVAPTPTLTETIVPTFTLLPTSTEILAVGASGIGDPYYPLMGNGGYDVKHYALDITVDMEGGTISATAGITARATQPLDRFDLDFWGFTIISLRVNGQDAAFNHKEGELIITPAEPLAAESDFTVDVAYSGKPGEGMHQSFLEGWNFYDRGVIVAGEPTGAETWFPVNNHPLDKATYTIRVTVETPYLVASNGVLQEQTDNGDGTQTFLWNMDDPMASYLATVDIGHFDILQDRTTSGVPVRSYLDSDIRASVEGPVLKIPAIIDYFESVFGPYPFDAVGVVAHELPLGFALEDQTLVVLGSEFDEITVVHELAHQWFGDSISLDAWKDIWLNEGFASYAEVLWLEHTKGKAAADQDIIKRFRFWATDPEQPIRIGDPEPDRLFDLAVYDRGALTLHSLRLIVGDTVFFQILRTYLERYGGGNASTADFIALAEEVSGRQLDSFFDGWLYQYEMPDIPEMGLYT